MIAFRTRYGRTWARRIDVAAAIRIRDLAGLDVMELAASEASGERLARLNDDSSVDLATAVYAIFLPDAQQAGWSARKFYRRLKAITPSELRELFFDGVVAFFRMPGPPRTGEDRHVTADELWQDLYRLAGEAGVDPGPLTFGELAAMAEGRRRDAWSRCAPLMASVINSNPFRSGPGVDPADLDPTGGLKEAGQSSRRKVELRHDDVWLLGRLFVGRG